MAEAKLDCSDLENYMGKAMTPWSLKESLHNNDFRRWVQAMHYPNLLHYDEEFASTGRFGRLVAPQSFTIAAAEGHGSCPAGIGRIPNSHLIFGGDEWWFYGPRLFAGDKLSHEKIPFDYAVKETRFAGPTCFQRGDNIYYNQYGDPVAKQRSTAIRYLPELAKEMGSMAVSDDPEWSDDELIQVEEDKLEYIKMLHELGHGRRSWAAVEVGESLPIRVFGPHSIASFATEWRAYLMNVWGGSHRNQDCNPEKLGFLDEMAEWEMDPVMEKKNPELTDGAYIGASRGHLNPRFARLIGMPRGYGYGASMGAWILDYLAGWAGEWGHVVHCNAQYRSPALTGDISIITGKIVDKLNDGNTQAVVQIDCEMTTQTGAVMATARAEVALSE